MYEGLPPTNQDLPNFTIPQNSTLTVFVLLQIWPINRNLSGLQNIAWGGTRTHDPVLTQDDIGDKSIGMQGERERHIRPTYREDMTKITRISFVFS